MAVLRLSRRAAKDLDGLPKKVAQRVADAIEHLGNNPENSSFDVKLLVGRRPWRRLRVGDYRVLFLMADRGRVMLVGRVIDRQDLERAVRTLPE